MFYLLDYDKYDFHELKIYVYIIDYYNPSVRIIDLFSYTTFVVCVNFIHKWAGPIV